MRGIQSRKIHNLSSVAKWEYYYGSWTNLIELWLSTKKSIITCTLKVLKVTTLTLCLFVITWRQQRSKISPHPQTKKNMTLSASLIELVMNYRIKMPLVLGYNWKGVGLTHLVLIRNQQVIKSRSVNYIIYICNFFGTSINILI